MANNELYHWGIKGQQWGVRRFQNPDGTLTEEGKQRYGKGKIMFFDTTNEKVSGSIAKQKSAAKRINAAEKAVKTYGGVNAAKAEVQSDYATTEVKNWLKTAGAVTLSSGSTMVGLMALEEASSTIGAVLAGTVAGLGGTATVAIAIGSAIAGYLLDKNRKLSVSYINDVGNRRGDTKNVVNSFSR